MVAVSLQVSDASGKNQSKELLRLMVSNNVSSTETILRIFESIAVDGERSVPVLSRVKNYLRSCQSDESLSNLSILSII